MGSDHNQPADIDPLALKNARDLWCNFTHMAKYGVIAVMALLLLMAIFVA